MTVSRETKLRLYRDLIIKWGASLNLSSCRDSDAAGILGHIEDSLTLVDYLPRDLTRLIDLGSGQGFPAVPLAIVTGIAVDLIEADRRKAAFLTATMAALDLKGAVWPVRIERANVPPAMCVSARALAPLSRLLVLAKPFVAPTGTCLFLKGPKANEEVAEAALTQHFTHEIFATQSARSNLVRISNLG